MQRCRKHLESGGVFQHFSYFLAISESGGVTKSQPIEQFFDVMYLFLNVRLGQKLFKFIHFWVPSSTLWVYYLALFALNSSFFTLLSKIFLMTFFFYAPINFLPPYKFFYPSKNFSPPLLIFYPPKNFFTSLNFFTSPIFHHPPLFFLTSSSTFHFWATLKSGGGVLTPKIPPASAPLAVWKLWIVVIYVT